MDGARLAHAGAKVQIDRGNEANRLGNLWYETEPPDGDFEEAIEYLTAAVEYYNEAIRISLLGSTYVRRGLEALSPDVGGPGSGP